MSAKKKLFNFTKSYCVPSEIRSECITSTSRQETKGINKDCDTRRDDGHRCGQGSGSQQEASKAPGTRRVGRHDPPLPGPWPEGVAGGLPASQEGRRRQPPAEGEAAADLMQRGSQGPASVSFLASCRARPAAPNPTGSCKQGRPVAVGIFNLLGAEQGGEWICRARGDSRKNTGDPERRKTDGLWTEEVGRSPREDGDKLF